MDKNHRVQNFILNNFPFDHFFCRPIFSCVFERRREVAFSTPGCFQPDVGYKGWWRMECGGALMRAFEQEQDGCLKTSGGGEDMQGSNWQERKGRVEGWLW